MTKRALLLAATLLLLAVGCTPPGGPQPTFSVGPTAASGSAATATPFQPDSFTPAPVTPAPAASEVMHWWTALPLPPGLRTATAAWTVPMAGREDAALVLELAAPAADVGDDAATWVFALVAPFPTLTDNVAYSDLLAAWTGAPGGTLAGHPIVTDGATAAALTALMGPPSTSTVRILAEPELLPTAWEEQTTWALVPFEALEPRWKVLSLDGRSPLHKELDLAAYPLVARYILTCPAGCPEEVPALPQTNRDPARLTTLVMTGVTALVRATAYKMETKGLTYPGEDIGEILRSADIAHISNEIPFATDCPYPDPGQIRLIFCSDPKYIALLEDVGADVIELTGNHFQDWGSAATRYTVQIYNERGWPYFGGGADLQDARKAVRMEVNGNRIAFVGCNPVGPDFAWARADYPGAAPCEDYAWMVETIRTLRSEGYLPVATFQYYEYYTPEARPDQAAAFRMMAEAGAVIVSGSQAHSPQAMEFHQGAFVHYGLGNLFFDQMHTDAHTRKEFIDRHVFYDGRYIGVELLTAMLEDYARPRLMTPQERSDLLTFIWGYTDWSQLP